MYEIFEQLIRDRNLTSYRVSKETGIAQSTFSDWKRGRSMPGPEKLMRIADYLGVTVDCLLGRQENSQPAAEDGDRLADEFDRLFSKITPAQRDLVLAAMRDMLSK